MTKLESGTPLPFALALAIAACVLSQRPLSAIEAQVEASDSAVSEIAESEASTEPSEATEDVDPELIDVSEIIPLLKEEGFNSESLARLGNEGQLSHFDGGSFLFVNASEKNVAIQMGDTRFELEPDQGKLLHPIASHRGGACQVTLSYQRDEGWKIFRKTRWMTTKGYRSLIFFHQDSKSGKLVVTPVVDILPYDASKDEQSRSFQLPAVYTCKF